MHDDKPTLSPLRNAPVAHPRRLGHETKGHSLGSCSSTQTQCHDHPPGQDPSPVRPETCSPEPFLPYGPRPFEKKRKKKKKHGPATTVKVPSTITRFVEFLHDQLRHRPAPSSDVSIIASRRRLRRRLCVGPVHLARRPDVCTAVAVGLHEYLVLSSLPLSLSSNTTSCASCVLQEPRARHDRNPIEPSELPCRRLTWRPVRHSCRGSTALISWARTRITSLAPPIPSASHLDYPITLSTRPCRPDLGLCSKWSCAATALFDAIEDQIRIRRRKKRQSQWFRRCTRCNLRVSTFIYR
jgi:hypothetical protein